MWRNKIPTWFCLIMKTVKYWSWFVHWGWSLLSTIALLSTEQSSLAINVCEMRVCCIYVTHLFTYLLVFIFTAQLKTQLWRTIAGVMAHFAIMVDTLHVMISIILVSYMIWFLCIIALPVMCELWNIMNIVSVCSCIGMTITSTHH